ncbi:MAG: hypothetical protein HKN06_12445 [Gammaproteobacteria bacterium]|nr:hypothetical protein [Gammaproteobacteria bacterium]
MYKGTISALVLGALLGLSGCGSSGSGDATQQQVSQDPLPPQSSGESLVLSGQVTDMPIPNATVIVTVDGQAFQAALPTDANGNYEVEIFSDNPDALVLMEAFDPNGTVRFTALLDDFSGFQAEADETGRVADKDITNVTTAHYILATRATSDQSIDDADELTDSSALVSAGAALELSAAIKLVVESIAGVTLPPEFDDTQDLAEAIVDGNSTFLEDVAAVNSTALDTAVDLVLNDGNATIAWQAERVPGVYLAREGLSIYAFFADGTGLTTSYDRDGVTGLQWAVNDAGKLLVSYMNNSAENDIVTLLNHTGNVLSIMVEERDADTTVNDDPTTVLFFPFADGFTIENAPGSYTTMGEPGHLKVLLPDHTGYDLDLVTGAQNEPFFWEVSSEGVMWITDASGERNTTQARVLGGAADGGLHLLVTELGPDGLVSYMNVITVRKVDTIASAPSDVDAPDLTLAGNSYAFIDGTEIDVFQFRADGEVRQVGQHVRDDGTSELVDRRGDWNMVDDQTIRIWMDDQDEAEDARVLDGLGQDEMLVQTPEDIAEGTERLVTRIIPLELDSLAGGYYLLDENGAMQNEFVEIRTDFTGYRMVDGVIQDEFDWSVDERGNMVVTPRSDSALNARTLTLRLLAGGAPGTTIRVVMENRVNGILTADDSGRAMTVVQLLREG